jgi:hypothetical protein
VVICWVIFGSASYQAGTLLTSLLQQWSHIRPRQKWEGPLFSWIELIQQSFEGWPLLFPLSSVAKETPGMFKLRTKSPKQLSVQFAAPYSILWSMAAIGLQWTCSSAWRNFPNSMSVLVDLLSKIHRCAFVYFPSKPAQQPSRFHLLASEDRHFCKILYISSCKVIRV